MLEYIEALDALAQTGTMGKAGIRLRLSQSAVSKRIATLEARLGEPLVERQGRRVVLTPRATRLLQRVGPILAELRAALSDEGDALKGRTLTIGVSESIMASWGASLLATARAALPGVELELHTHRSPVVIERVAAGEYLLGLIAGSASDAAQLSVTELAHEPMALIPAGLDLARLPEAGDVPVMTIEARSGTWDALARRAKQLGLVPERRLESFFAVARLALAGFGHGLVPLGVVRAHGLTPGAVRTFPRGALDRPVSLVARRSVIARPLVAAFAAAVAKEAAGLAREWASVP